MKRFLRYPNARSPRRRRGVLTTWPALERFATRRKSMNESGDVRSGSFGFVRRTRQRNV